LASKKKKKDFCTSSSQDKIIFSLKFESPRRVDEMHASVDKHENFQMWMKEKSACVAVHVKFLIREGTGDDDIDWFSTFIVKWFWMLVSEILFMVNLKYFLFKNILK
jgi:hypothetical protein